MTINFLSDGIREIPISAGGTGEEGAGLSARPYMGMTCIDGLRCLHYSTIATFLSVIHVDNVMLYSSCLAGLNCRQHS